MPNEPTHLCPSDRALPAQDSKQARQTALLDNTNRNRRSIPTCLRNPSNKYIAEGERSDQRQRPTVKMQATSRHTQLDRRSSKKLKRRRWRVKLRPTSTRFSTGRAATGASGDALCQTFDVSGHGRVEVAEDVADPRAEGNCEEAQ